MWTYPITSPQLQIWILAVSCVFAAYATFRLPLPGWKRGFRWLASRTHLCALLVFSLSIMLSITLSTLRPVKPWVHDEYSYLLASDTFAHGRLSNPQHPLAEFFETFHVLSSPTYCSKYPPGNGLFLALGQWMTGHPIAGVWCSLALASVATYWMLLAWTRSTWALLGGLAIVIHAPLLRAWGQSYWGGAVAMLGGALVFGGLRRLWNQPKWYDAIALGLGMVILANSRPAEGFLVSLPVAAVAAYWLIRSTASMTTKLIQVVLPLSVIGLAGVCWLGIYNAATTGDPLTMPYQLHDARYSASSLFIWQTPPPIPEYDHQRLQDYFVGVARERQLSLREPAVYLNAMSMKLYLLWDFFPLGLGLGLLSIPSLWNDRWMRLSILTGGVVLAIQTQLATTWIFPHYLAPLAAVFYAVNLNGLRCLAVWKRDRKTGRIIVRAIAIALLVELGFTLVVWSQPLPEHPRERVLTRLSEFEDSKHLVLVSYKSGHSVHDEYVYNQADIDAARVVWARDLGAEKNGRLLQHFSDRMIWRWTLEADDNEILEIIPPADHGYPREPAGVLVGTEIESEIDPHPCGRTR